MFERSLGIDMAFSLATNTNWFLSQIVVVSYDDLAVAFFLYGLNIFG